MGYIMLAFLLKDVYYSLWSRRAPDTKKWRNKLRREFLEKGRVKGEKRIAIIGGGIAGCNSALYLRDIFKDKVVIDVFEKEKVIGGRTSNENFDGDYLDVGGTSIINENYYAQELLERFDLSFRPETASKLVIYDGNGPRFVSSKYSLISLLKLLWYYPLGLFQTFSIVNKTLDKFLRLYAWQGELMTWNHPKEFLEKLQLQDMAESSAKDYYAKKISSKFVDDFLVAISRVNYLQGKKMSAFSFAISSTAATTEFHTVDGGTFQFASRAFYEAGVNEHIHCPIKEIRKVSNQYELIGEFQGPKKLYDAVIIAAPLEKAGIQFPNISIPSGSEFKRAFVTVHVTLVRGLVNNSVFSMTDEDPNAPFEYIFLNEDSPFTCINFVRKSKIHPTCNIYKLFSKMKLSQDMLSKYFSVINDTLQTQFDAYPYYFPENHNNWHPVAIDKGVYEINNMESIVSTMETELISAVNVVTRVSKQLIHSW